MSIKRILTAILGAAIIAASSTASQASVSSHLGSSVKVAGFVLDDLVYKPWPDPFPRPWPPRPPFPTPKPDFPVF